MTRDEILESLKEARSAARYAARDAEWYSARSAASSASCYAAEYAAWSASCYTAGYAASSTKIAGKRINHREVTLDLV
jgi:hypothetical protein